MGGGSLDNGSLELTETSLNNDGMMQHIFVVLKLILKLENVVSNL